MVRSFYLQPTAHLAAMAQRRRLVLLALVVALVAVDLIHRLGTFLQLQGNQVGQAARLREALG